MSTQWVYGIEDFSNVSVPVIGGKAFHLMRLVELGLHVPAFYVISAEAFSQTVDIESLDLHAGIAEQVASEIRQRIHSATLDPEILRSIEEAHSGCFSDDEFVAVRSSAVSEDGSRLSFAGMYESVLGVRDRTALIAAIKSVWISAVNPRVIAYRQMNGLPLLDTKMAVIVQEMVDANCSGVCFTCDPASGSNDLLMISALPGIGEGLVSRSFPADSYRVDKATLTVSADLVEKKERLQLDRESGGLRQLDVDPADRKLSSLSPQQVAQVAESALAIETAFGQPQDMEFCYTEDTQLFILQSRPVTGFKSTDEHDQQRNPRDNHVIWDNSNIIESYSGVTTPMTFSFIRRAYSIVYHCFAEVMGISPGVVKSNRATFENMLGLFHGRVYYNLNNWYRLVGMFPGYHYNRHFMEAMMGVKQSAALEEQSVPISRWRRWFVEFPALIRLVARSGWNFIRIRKTVERFESHFYRYHDEWAKIDFDSIPPHEMSQLYDMMEQKMLWNWKAPIINDFFVMIFYGLLRKMCVSWCNDETASLQNGLVCGEGGLQSDEPAKRLIRMTQVVIADPALRDLVLNQDVQRLPILIAEDPRFEEFNALMSGYLEDFGLRCANELKLESYSYQDQPHRLYQIIRNYLATNDTSIYDLDAIMQREQNIRQTAEKQANEKLSESRTWFPRKLLFRMVVKNARLGIRNRENMRFARTRIYGILRRILRSVGTQFADQGILDEREDVFYLTLDEVWSYVRGTAVTSDLRGLANFRKTEYEAYRSGLIPAPDDRFETHGLPYHGHSFKQDKPREVSEQNDLLSGIGCCPGIVRGTVQVVSDPARDTYFEGDILVAQRTDPGWVPFYPAFSGILVERGSMLSHSAIVAREMGIPTIVSISGLTQRIRSGQRVEMDGSTGTVQIIVSK